jgi:hypothetical protein
LFKDNSSRSSLKAKHFVFSAWPLEYCPNGEYATKVMTRVQSTDEGNNPEGIHGIRLTCQGDSTVDSNVQTVGTWADGTDDIITCNDGFDASSIGNNSVC